MDDLAYNGRQVVAAMVEVTAKSGLKRRLLVPTELIEIVPDPGGF